MTGDPRTKARRPSTLVLGPRGHRAASPRATCPMNGPTFGQRVMQATSDIFLGWTTAQVGDHQRVAFYVRQLNDHKASIDVSKMTERRLSWYGETCAEALARAHARSGSASAIGGYLGKGEVFDEARASFAVAYADQDRRDYEAFAEAAAEGRMVVSREA